MDKYEKSQNFSFLLQSVSAQWSKTFFFGGGGSIMPSAQIRLSRDISSDLSG